MIKTKIRWTWATVIFVSLVPRTFGAAESMSDIANKIRTEVAGIIAGINAHDVDQATHFDSDDIVSMESGRPAPHGILEERKGLSEAFHYAPTWQLSLIEETVDVANSRELAIYKSTYNSESVDNDVPMTQRANFIAEFRRNKTGEFKVVWSPLPPNTSALCRSTAIDAEGIRVHLHASAGHGHSRHQVRKTTMTCATARQKYPPTREYLRRGGPPSR